MALPPTSEGADDLAPVDVPSHPNVPNRGAVWLAFAGVMVSGILGGTIGWGLVDASCSDKPMTVQRILRDVPGYVQHVPSCDTYRLLGAVFGALVCAVGAAIVAVLALRAMSEWRAHPPPPGFSDVGAGQPSTIRRKPSA
ncbi:MAG: hypothetical protein JWL83_204 [Actinomycetia bacterium]|nr:hypothetical protein [Actinomycetes bacterium]